MLDYARPGDTLVVAAIDRLGHPGGWQEGTPWGRRAWEEYWRRQKS